MAATTASHNGTPHNGAIHNGAPHADLGTRRGGRPDELPTALAADVATGLAALDQQLDALYRHRLGGTLGAKNAARHLLDGGGKRVRPLLCLLAARVGSSDPRRAWPLAQAAELVHNATLLHDDVVDVGETRRGRQTARAVFGNAAAVLGGDLLLVEALTAIHTSELPQLLPAMLGVLRRMVEAESLQLATRGHTDLTTQTHLRICVGKTASLFGWVTEAGARAGGAAPDTAIALRRYGHDIGIAFQLVDDLLDLTADPDVAGKAVLQDVRQGTVTYAAIPALRADGPLAARVRAAATGSADGDLGRDLVAAVQRHGGLERARQLITTRTRRARSALRPLGGRHAAQALDRIAVELAERSR